MSYTFATLTDRIQTASGLVTAAPLCLGCFFKLSNHADGLFHNFLTVTAGAGGGASNGFGLAYDCVASKVNAFMFYGGTQLNILAGAVADENWHFAAFNIASTTSRYSRLDATAGTVETTSATPTAAAINRSTIGSFQDSDGTFYNSAGHTIAGAFIYNTNLTSGQLDALQAGDAPNSVQPANLVACTPLISSAADWKGATWTVTGATVATTHPNLRWMNTLRRPSRFFIPRRKFYIPSSRAA